MPKTKQSAGARRGYLNSKTMAESRSLTARKKAYYATGEDVKKRGQSGSIVQAARAMYDSYLNGKEGKAIREQERSNWKKRRIRNGDAATYNNKKEKYPSGPSPKAPAGFDWKKNR